MIDCLKFECNDNCCKYGADVYPEEYEELLALGLAAPEEFTGPEEEEDGEVLYRTALGERGCIFLNSGRGCRLYAYGKRPFVCTIFPRDEEEAQEAHLDGYLPCYASEDFEIRKTEEACEVTEPAT